MLRHQLTDEQWDLIADWLGPPKPTNRSRNIQRQMVDGCLWILNTGAQWRDLPSQLGAKSTVRGYFDRWNANDTLLAIVEWLIRWLKECRWVFTRFEKTADKFAGMIRLSFIQRKPRLMT